MPGKSKVPVEWDVRSQEKVVDGKKGTEGVVRGGDIIGSFVEVDGATMLTLGSEGSADWLVRVVAPAPLAMCLEAAVLAAERLGVVER